MFSMTKISLCIIGMKTILALFFVHRLDMNEREATEAMAWFAVASYATPLLGAYISDSLIGKLRFLYVFSLCVCTV